MSMLPHVRRWGLGAVVAVGAALSFGHALAQSYQLKQGSFALKAGETVEASDLYWVINCRSQLTGTPQVTILDGPPGLTATVVEASVLPRAQNCPRPVKGGKLMLKAETVDDQSNSLMTLRIKYPTKDGDREQSLTFSIALFP